MENGENLSSEGGKEDFDGEDNNNSENEIEMLMKNAHEAMGVGLKEEKKVSNTEKKLIKRGEETLENVAKKAEKNYAKMGEGKALGSDFGKSAAERADPTGLYTFLEDYEPALDLGLQAISKMIINKVVDEASEKYYFITKVAATIALKQAFFLITDIGSPGSVNILSIKLDVIKKKLEEVSKKVDTIIEEPMKTAGNHFLRALFHIEAGDYEESLPEIREALNNSLKAINYIKGNKKYMKGIVTCIKFLALGDQLMEKYDKENKVFLPYDILPIQKKIKLRTIMKGHLDTLIEANNQTKKKAHIFKTTAGKKLMEVEHHDVVDDFARQQFPLLVPPGSMIPPKYLPAGHVDAVIYNVHKKTTWSQKHLGSLLLMWKNEEETHFRIIDGDQLLEFPITEDEEIDISLSKSGTMVFSANDGSEIIPTSLSLKEEYPNIVEDWETYERDDCLKLYNAFFTINRQAPVEKKNEVLWEAAKNGDIDKITYAINVGAEIDSREPAPIIDPNEGKGKLSKLKSKAFAFVDKEVSKRKGAVSKEEETSRDDMSALHNTAKAGHTECSYRLLELGANPNIEDKDFSTPLHWAARNGHLQTVEVLCEDGANIMAQNRTGITAQDETVDEKIKEYLTLMMDEANNK